MGFRKSLLITRGINQTSSKVRSWFLIKARIFYFGNQSRTTLPFFSDKQQHLFNEISDLNMVPNPPLLRKPSEIHPVRPVTNSESQGQVIFVLVIHTDFAPRAGEMSKACCCRFAWYGLIIAPVLCSISLCDKSTYYYFISSQLLYLFPKK